MIFICSFRSLESNKSEECETGTSDEAGDECSLAEIKNVGDYKEIFQPRQECMLYNMHEQIDFYYLFFILFLIYIL